MPTNSPIDGNDIPLTVALERLLALLPSADRDGARRIFEELARRSLDPTTPWDSSILTDTQPSGPVLSAFEIEVGNGSTRETVGGAIETWKRSLRAAIRARGLMDSADDEPGP